MVKLQNSSNPRNKNSKLLLKPKIHKEGNPGRPVISSVSCHTTKVSQYLGHHLQQHVQELGSNVKILTDFIKKYLKLTKYRKNGF